MLGSSRVKLVFQPGWEDIAFRSTETKTLIALHTAKLAAVAIKETPKRRGNNSYTATKHNVEHFVQNSLKGWYGNVVVDRNPRVRHAMLTERGFTDRAGRRHPGRKWLKAALLKQRIE
ncbi:hypothetical protein OG897_08490 [Streptomyces sp. NBC_00237]|uniref:hypothetical protein n=1 Tax=Streptomyces sp. NBC_00237 TaxID=2975687 RepID=UPI002250626C|nr:hypothetical protein [Streptomyces sp. NBC_00237]MCX5201489.1 hypothetical protein [Streptomyces sp. NBC_00237]